MDSAIRSVYGRLKQVLEANGLSFADVVKETVFATDLDAFVKNKEIRKEFYGCVRPPPPGAQRLYSPSFVLEVEVTAAIPLAPRRCGSATFLPAVVRGLVKRSTSTPPLARITRCEPMLSDRW